MSEKECSHHCDEKKRLYRLRLFAAFLAFIIVILFIILLIFLILRPTKPHFILQDVTLNAFNISSDANLLTTNFQISLASRNPNARIGIYYDRLDVYATYRSQQITIPAQLPSTYQGHKDVTVWSPPLFGSVVPVAPYIANSLAQDQMTGVVLINIKVYGKVRFKVGTFISRHYRLNVNCPAYLTFGSKNNGFAVGPAVKYQLVQNCNVDV